LARPEEGFVNLVIDAAAFFGINSFDGIERRDIKIASKTTDIRWNLEVAFRFKFLRMTPPNRGDRVSITLARSRTKEEDQQQQRTGPPLEGFAGPSQNRAHGFGIFTR
jgi:hypothetical protein